MTNVTRVSIRLRSVWLPVVFLCIPGLLNALPILKQVSEIRKLTVADARQGFPVKLRGVVTYFDMLGPDMFFQDSSAGIWIHWTEGLPKPQKGQLIELEGFTTQEDFAPDIAQPHWRDPGAEAPPNPKKGKLMGGEGFPPGGDFPPHLPPPLWGVIGEGPMPK